MKNYHIKTIFLSLLTTIIIGIAFTQGTVKYLQNNIFDYIGLYVIAITLCLFLFYIAYVKIFQTIGDC